MYEIPYFEEKAYQIVISHRYGTLVPCGWYQAGVGRLTGWQGGALLIRAEEGLTVGLMEKG